jgi:hypothetical protein
MEVGLQTDHHQVVDYGTADDDNNVKMEFEGPQLREWLDTEGKQRPLGEDGKPKGVRWSK